MLPPEDYNTSFIPVLLLIYGIFISVLLIITYFPLRGNAKIRKFTLSEEGIELNIPHKPLFQITWAEFDIIIVISHYLNGKSGEQNVSYELRFFDKNEKLIRKISLRINRDFSKEKIEKILLALKNNAHSLNKEIYGKNTSRKFKYDLINKLDLDKLMESKKMEPKMTAKMLPKVTVKKKTIIIVAIIIALVVIGIVMMFVFSIKTSADEERPDGTIISTVRFKEMSSRASLDCEGYVDLINTTDGDLVLYFYKTNIDAIPAKIFLSDKTTFNSQLVNLGTNVEIGPLPYNLGSFSVPIPDRVDITNYKTIVIVSGISNVITGYAAGIN